jgi:uncharacterized membrane protein
MKYIREFIVRTVVGGVFVVVPAYLAFLLLLKGMQSAEGLVRPVAALMPGGTAAQDLLSVAVILLVCFLVGVAVRTRVGRTVRRRIERVFFERLPGYGLIRSLTQRLAGQGGETAWKPALVEIEEALVPGFIIEEHEDGQYTVFVPSVPTPLAGAVYILTRARVHPLDVPFTQAIQSISRWGAGSRDLMAAMQAPHAHT